MVKKNASPTQPTTEEVNESSDKLVALTRYSDGRIRLDIRDSRYAIIPDYAGSDTSITFGLRAEAATGNTPAPEATVHRYPDERIRLTIRDPRYGIYNLHSGAGGGGNESNPTSATFGPRQPFTPARRGQTLRRVGP